MELGDFDRAPGCYKEIVDHFAKDEWPGTILIVAHARQFLSASTFLLKFLCLADK
jgi:hypothetical protein